MSDISRLLWRGPRLGLALGVSFTAVLATLLLFQAYARAAHIGPGAFNCGTFANAAGTVADGGLIVPMVPPRDSGSPTITKSVAIVGGWTRLDFSNCPPEYQNANNNVIITGVQGMLDAGFDYVAPITRSELNHSGAPIVTLVLTDKMVLLDHMIWGGNNAQVAAEGAGIRAEIRAGSAVRINNNLFELNETSTSGDSWGGGLYLYLADNANVTIEDSQFSQNWGGQGGGVYAEVRQHSHLLIERTQFSQNGANHGGGLSLFVDGTSHVTLREVSFTQNENGLVTSNGGAIYMVVETGGRVTILDSIFDGNKGGAMGGAIYAELNGGELVIGRSSFTNNEADELGSAFYLENNSPDDATLVLYGNHIADNGPANYINQVTNNAGALHIHTLENQLYVPLLANSYQPTAPYVAITGITRQPDYSYRVDFETENFTPALPGTHIHFFFNTVSPEQAGMPGSGPWEIYGGASPFTGYSFVERPYGLHGATHLCALVANPNHSVVLNSGNCYVLPEG